MTIQTGDSVTIEYTGRRDDGAVFDTTRESVATESGLAEADPDREYAPLTVELGTGEVIQGLEEALVGLEEGATPTVSVPPEKGYGERSEEAVRSFDAEEFAEMLGGEPPEVGGYVETQDGDVGEITEVGADVVRVDFNHFLAGETVEFDVEVVAVN